MLHLSKLVSRAVITAAATSVMLFGGAQVAQAAPDHQQDTAVATSSHLAYKSDVYRFTADQDGSVVVTKLDAASADNPADDAHTTASWKVKMSHEKTTSLYWAAVAGATGTVIGVCQYYMPAAADGACQVIGASLAAYVARMSMPGDNDCFGFEIRTRWGLPPWEFKIGYVDCD